MTLEVCAERAYDMKYETFAHTTDKEDEDNDLTLELQFEKRHVFYIVQLVFYRYKAEDKQLGFLAAISKSLCHRWQH